jgi:hypothetical protein
MSALLSIPPYKLVCNLSGTDPDTGEFIERVIIIPDKAMNVFLLEDATHILTYLSDGIVSYYEAVYAIPRVLVCISCTAAPSTPCLLHVDSIYALDHIACPEVLVCDDVYKVSFLANVSESALLESVGLQDSVYIYAGEPCLVFFRLYNPTLFSLSGVSIYFTYPPDSAVYVNKLQCFCSDMPSINAHETLELPVLFFLDPSIMLGSRKNNTFTETYIIYLFLSRA